MNFSIGLTGLQAAQQALELVGTNLANVNTIALGLGNRNPDVSGVAGGSGTMYFADIRLYAPASAP